MKSVSVAVLIFMVSCAAGFLAAPDPKKPSSQQETPPLETAPSPNAAPCIPDPFIRSQITADHIKKTAVTWQRFMEEVKTAAIKDMETQTGALAIHALAMAGETKSLKAYLESGINNAQINLRDKHGMTPLFIAVKNMDFDSMKVLLAHGADPHLTSRINGKEKDILQTVIDFENYVFKEYIETLSELGIPMEHGEKYLPQALKKSKITIVDALLPCTDVNAQAESGNHIFTEVLQLSKSRKLLDFFLNNEELVFENAYPGTPPLIAAVKNKAITPEDLSRMIEKGADMNWVNPSDNTSPLIACIKAGRTDLAKVLLQKGVNVTIRDIHGKTAKDYLGKTDTELARQLQREEI